mgnify:CR=1 FL=1
MYQRSRSRVGERPTIPSQSPSSYPHPTSLSPTPDNHAGAAGPGAEEWVVEVEGVYIISVAARILEMHPQTLRKYERLGLISPDRTVGMLRLYSRGDIRKVRLIRHLVDNLGFNLAGVEFTLGLVDDLLSLRERLSEAAEGIPLQATIEQEMARLFHHWGLPVK